jgi:phytol kinase
MPTELINTLFLSGAFLGLFAFAEILHVKLKIKAEVTRKIVHIGTGILTMLFPILVKDQWLVLFLCGSFAIILTLSLRFNFLKGINGIDRKSHGSISYPAAVYISYLFYFFQDQPNLLFFYLPVLTMALADPMAAFVGKRTNFIPVVVFGEKKTIGGFLGFFGTSILISIVLLNFFPCNTVNTFVLIISCAIVSATTELITTRGFDNITIPLSVILSIYLSQLH